MEESVKQIVSLIEESIVATLVACLVLTIVMHRIAAEWGRRTSIA
jgi:hypothetical protein